MSNSHTITNGVTGVLASASGFMVTFIEAMEAWVRLSTAVVLLFVALISLRNLIRSSNEKAKNKR
jgi:hypothetical protein